MGYKVNAGHDVDWVQRPLASGEGPPAGPLQQRRVRIGVPRFAAHWLRSSAMATPPAQALQRVCPHCATLSVTAANKCPWCRRSYRRRLLPYLALFAIVQTAITIGAVALLLTVFGDTLDTELDKQVTTVQRDFETQLDGLDATIRRELRKELDQRLPAQPGVPGTP